MNSYERIYSLLTEAFGKVPSKEDIKNQDKASAKFNEKHGPKRPWKLRDKEMEKMGYSINVKKAIDADDDDEAERVTSKLEKHRTTRNWYHGP